MQLGLSATAPLDLWERSSPGTGISSPGSEFSAPPGKEHLRAVSQQALFASLRRSQDWRLTTRSFARMLRRRSEQGSLCTAGPVPPPPPPPAPPPGPICLPEGRVPHLRVCSLDRLPSKGAWHLHLAQVDGGSAPLLSAPPAQKASEGAPGRLHPGAPSPLCPFACPPALQP